MPNYSILIKDKFFNPAPFAGNIPSIADSAANPRVIGTRLWEEFWSEMFSYCIHGYKTGGLFLPPRYFHYLNFYLIDGVGTGTIHPFFTDIHYELAMMDHDVYNDPYCAGDTDPKARRKGLSFWNVHRLVWGHRFKQNYRSAVASGLEIYVNGFHDKMTRTFNNTVPEMRMNVQINSEKEFITAYDEKTEYGWQPVQNGYTLFQTLRHNSAALEGEYYDDVVIDEVGETSEADETIQSVSHALRDGSSYVGKLHLPGTGGNMQAAGQIFANICANAESMGLRKMFIPRYRFHKPFIRTADGNYKTPNLDRLYPKLHPSQLLGCEDVEAAEEAIQKEMLRLSKNPNKQKLKEFQQDMPFTEQDVFTSAGKNDFDTTLIYEQNYNIDSEAYPRWKEYILDWAKDEDGHIKEPCAVTCRPVKLEDKEWQKVKILDGEMPSVRYKDLDITGCDGYDIDQSSTSKSLGGIIVCRAYDELQCDVEMKGFVPVLIYYQRPPLKEQFWDMCAKISVFYNTVGNTMIGADSDMLVGYMKDQGFRRYLSPRPRSLESKDSKQTHEFCIRYNGSNKPKMISFLQSWVAFNIQFSFFKDLNNDIAAYNTESMGNDWDLADALGNALARKIDRKKRPTENTEIQADRYSFDNKNDRPDEDMSITDPFGKRNWL